MVVAGGLSDCEELSGDLEIRGPHQKALSSKQGLSKMEYFRKDHSFIKAM